jgi:hypothetical protein
MIAETTGLLLQKERQGHRLKQGHRPRRDPAPPAISPVWGFGGDGTISRRELNGGSR